MLHKAGNVGFIRARTTELRRKGHVLRELNITQCRSIIKSSTRLTYFNYKYPYQLKRINEQVPSNAELHLR